MHSLWSQVLADPIMFSVWQAEYTVLRIEPRALGIYFTTELHLHPIYTFFLRKGLSVAHGVFKLKTVLLPQSPKCSHHAWLLHSLMYSMELSFSNTPEEVLPYPLGQVLWLITSPVLSVSRLLHWTYVYFWDSLFLHNSRWPQVQNPLAPDPRCWDYICKPPRWSVLCSTSIPPWNGHFLQGGKYCFCWFGHHQCPIQKPAKSCHGFSPVLRGMHEILEHRFYKWAYWKQ